MKSKRQEKILQLIHDHDIETQEQLLSELREAGFQTTQATISRDIKQLRIIKELGRTGHTATAYRQSRWSIPSPQKLNIIFKQCLTSVEHAQNILVIKTMPGLASAACSALDKMNIPEIVGTLAGDDTAFIAMRDSASASTLCAELRGTDHTLSRRRRMLC